MSSGSIGCIFPAPIHIALLIPTIDQIGGAERQVLLLAVELARRQFRVTIIALSGTGNLSSQDLSCARVSFLTLQMRKAWVDPYGWFRYLRWAGQNKPDILHAHLPHAIWFARLVRILSPVRLVIDTIHTSRTPSMFQRFAFRTTRALSDLTTCVSEAVATTTLAAQLVEPRKCRVLLNGVPLHKSSPAINLTQLQSEKPCESPIAPHTSEDDASNPFQWIAIGRLVPVKDYPNLLKAFSSLCSPAELTILGSGPDLKSLTLLSELLGIEDRIHFAGFQHDINPYLDRADGFVLSSKWEGLPIGALEAQAACLPVVATRAAGTVEAVLDGVSALLVPAQDPSALTSAMHQLMNMPLAKRAQMGQSGQKFVKETFEMTVVAEQWQMLFSSLLLEQPRVHRWSWIGFAPARKKN